MPYDGNGIASVAGQRPVNGQDTDAAQITVPLADIEAMLSQVLLKSGVAPMTGNLNMNGFKVNGLGEATEDGDAISLAKLNSEISELIKALVPTGTVAGFRRNSAPTGWIVENGNTIGNALSGATNRANADTKDLFTLLWTEFSNTILPIESSSGAASTRGASAEADFNANKRLPIFDSRTRFLRGSDRGTNFDVTLVPGATQSDTLKEHTHTVPPHSHNVPSRSRAEYGFNEGGSRVGSVNGSNLPGSSSDPFDTSNSTSFQTGTTGNSLETRPRSSVVLYCIKL